MCLLYVCRLAILAFVFVRAVVDQHAGPVCALLAILACREWFVSWLDMDAPNPEHPGFYAAIAIVMGLLAVEILLIGLVVVWSLTPGVSP